jgi:DNA-binding transcriptional regulator GbsR (MarR family)
MTETTDDTKRLAPAVEQFVLHWGDMGGQWGVNRSVAQIQALLYLSDRPLTAEDIADALGMARSNVSNSIRELITWKLIQRVPVLGDRRDHYQAEADLWQILTRVAQGRKEREVDPAVAALRQVLDTADRDPRIGTVARARLHEMHDFLAQPDADGAAEHADVAHQARLARRHPAEPGSRETLQEARRGLKICPYISLVTEMTDIRKEGRQW